MRIGFEQRASFVLLLCAYSGSTETVEKYSADVIQGLSVQNADLTNQSKIASVSVGGPQRLLELDGDTPYAPKYEFHFDLLWRRSHPQTSKKLVFQGGARGRLTHE